MERLPDFRLSESALIKKKKKKKDGVKKIKKPQLNYPLWEKTKLLNLQIHPSQYTKMNI